MTVDGRFWDGRLCTMMHTYNMPWKRMCVDYDVSHCNECEYVRWRFQCWVRVCTSNIRWRVAIGFGTHPSQYKLYKGTSETKLTKNSTSLVKISSVNNVRLDDRLGSAEHHRATSDGAATFWEILRFVRPVSTNNNLKHARNSLTELRV